MTNRNWVFSLITSITLLGFYLIANSIGYEATGFVVLSAAIILVTAYNHFTANASNPLIRPSISSIELGAGDK